MTVMLHERYPAFFSNIAWDGLHCDLTYKSAVTRSETSICYLLIKREMRRCYSVFGNVLHKTWEMSIED